mgnify:CR=1 FL=1|tara:strand:+ start:73 stop:921 length:849 start_codon:yes stop_codon:yes gene_type:complete
MAKKMTMKAKEIDLSIVRYSDVKKMDSGSKIAYVNYGKEGINSIFLETPEMTFPFDNTWYPNPDGKGGKYSCKVSLKTDGNPDMEEFVSKMSDFDAKIKADAKENCKAWFGKQTISDDVIDDKYVPIVRHYKDPNTGEFTGKFPAQMGFKVIQRNGNFDCKFYDDSRQRINIDDTEGENYQEVSKLLSKGTTVRLLLKCNGLWFSSAGFGATWKAEQIKLKIPESLEEYAFRDDDEDTFVDEKDEDEDMNDDDDDEEDTDEMEDEMEDDEEPVKIVKKKAKK